MSGEREATLAAAVAVAFVLFAVAGSTATTTAAQATPAASAAAPAAGYAGEDTCLTCHEGQSVKGTAHGRGYNENTPAAAQGCESCHGPGKEHAEAGGDKSEDQEPEEA